MLCICREKQRLFPKVTVSGSHTHLSQQMPARPCRALKTEPQKPVTRKSSSVWIQLLHALSLRNWCWTVKNSQFFSCPPCPPRGPWIVLFHDCVHMIWNEPWRGGREGQKARFSVYVTDLFLAISLQLFLRGLITALSAYTSDLTLHFNYLLYVNTADSFFSITPSCN